MNNASHTNSDNSLSTATNAIVTQLKSAVEYCLDNDIQVGSVELANAISKKLSLPIALCQSVVSYWFSQHETLEVVKGPLGGVKYKSEKTAPSETSVKVPKAAKPMPRIPGLSD